MPHGDATHGCTDVGSVLYVLLERNIVVEVARGDVLEDEMLSLVSEI
jgi:hypothetical protein